MGGWYAIRNRIISRQGRRDGPWPISVPHDSIDNRQALFQASSCSLSSWNFHARCQVLPLCPGFMSRALLPSRNIGQPSIIPVGNVQRGRGVSVSYSTCGLFVLVCDILPRSFFFSQEERARAFCQFAWLKSADCKGDHSLSRSAVASILRRAQLPVPCPLLRSGSYTLVQLGAR